MMMTVVDPTTSTSTMPSLSTSSSMMPIVITFVALIIGIAAQSFINQMIQGEDGLGAYLQDGTGYNKSNFRVTKKNKGKRNIYDIDNDDDKEIDPLPWLQLPQFDFVDVAGQEKPRQVKQPNKLIKGVGGADGIDVPTLQESTLVYNELEQLRIRLVREVHEENWMEVQKLEDQLEQRMKQEGIQFTPSSMTSTTATPEEEGFD